MSGAAAMLCLPVRLVLAGGGGSQKGGQGIPPAWPGAIPLGRKQKNTLFSRVPRRPTVLWTISVVLWISAEFLAAREEPLNETAWWRRKNCGTNGGASRMGSGASRDRHTEGMVETHDSSTEGPATRWRFRGAGRGRGRSHLRPGGGHGQPAGE